MQLPDAPPGFGNTHLQNSESRKQESWEETRPFLAALMLPSPPDPLLDWDEFHLLNKQGRYCYCGKDRAQDEPALQCKRCGNWFHPSCVAALGRPLFHGEFRMFSFECKHCSSTGCENLVERRRTWMHTGIIALAHLMISEKKKWFRIRDVANFIEEKWENLCKHHQLHERWRVILSNALYTTIRVGTDVHQMHPYGYQDPSARLIMRSEALGLTKGYLTIKDFSECFPEVAMVILEDNLSAEARRASTEKPTVRPEGRGRTTKRQRTSQSQSETSCVVPKDSKPSGQASQIPPFVLPPFLLGPLGLLSSGSANPTSVSGQQTVAADAAANLQPTLPYGFLPGPYPLQPLFTTPFHSQIHQALRLGMAGMAANGLCGPQEPASSAQAPVDAPDPAALDAAVTKSCVGK
eukprot:TRINITY_DN2784_c0_g1_i1.p1 TRINITY_DN2784_c0_g1~~TRINITY_DN2784_c0_g1_i1.p1  ORF type:complete len:426 (+),score=49.21 TRINITY_DN2784_c0_g1_i1:56-1279(+)